MELQKKEKDHTLTPATLINHSVVCCIGVSREHLPDTHSPSNRKHTHTENEPYSWSAASAPAAIAADKLGRLIASQKLLATLGISGPVGAC